MSEQFKNDLYSILKKHDVNIDECYEVLDEMFYETYNGTNTCGNSEHKCGCSSHTTCSNSESVAEDPDIINNNPNCNF
jgi:hypothetical protein